jgi:hypothetical protein
MILLSLCSERLYSMSTQLQREWSLTSSNTDRVYDIRITIWNSYSALTFERINLSQP